MQVYFCSIILFKLNDFKFNLNVQIRVYLLVFHFIIKFLYLFCFFIFLMSLMDFYVSIQRIGII